MLIEYFYMFLVLGGGELFWDVGLMFDDDDDRNTIVCQ